MIVIMIGQDVLGREGDHRADETYRDVTSVLHECQRLQGHLTAQDETIVGIVEHLRQQTGARRMGGQAGKTSGEQGNGHRSRPCAPGVGCRPVWRVRGINVAAGARQRTAPPHLCPRARERVVALPGTRPGM